jgi:CHASE3 domain sensor protein
MNRGIQIGSALLLVAAVAVLALVALVYRRDRNYYQKIYTQAVKQRDISDTARNAVSALQDAELREQDYVLTGETTYSEAYADDIRAWQDEIGTLELLAQHDPAASMVQELSKNGTRVLNELTLIFSLRDGGSRNAALERIQKGSGIVYLDQARDLVTRIQRLDGAAADMANQTLIKAALRSHLRLAAAALALFCLTLAGTLLPILGRRRQGRPSHGVESREEPYRKPAS